MPFEVRDDPPFSWSVSRRSTFRECPRRYFYHYYGYHNGWLDGAPPLARAAYKLRTLKSLPMLAGEVLHELFANALRDVRAGLAVPTSAQLFALARKRMNEAWAQSKGRREWEQRPGKLAMLHEFYYRHEPSDARIDAARARLAAAIDGYLASRSFSEARAAPLVEIKDIDREGHFELDGVRVYAAPDVAYRLGDGSWTIVDWKSGQEGEGHAAQIAVYGLYLRVRHGVRGGIAGRIEYVAERKREDVTIDEAALDAAEREVREGVASMRGYLADPVANRARGIEAFPLRDDRHGCPYCNFYELCRDEIVAGGGPPGPF